MEWWFVIGIFLLGSGAGAITTAAYYSGQIHRLKRLMETASQSQSLEEPNSHLEDESRKSA